jgi:hypothetical protein
MIKTTVKKASMEDYKEGGREKSERGCKEVGEGREEGRENSKSKAVSRGPRFWKIIIFEICLSYLLEYCWTQLMQNLEARLDKISCEKNNDRKHSVHPKPKLFTTSSSIV